VNGNGKPEPTKRLSEIGDFIERTARNSKTLVVTNKPVRCALTGEAEEGTLPISGHYRGAEIAYFGNLRGSNEFEGHDTVIILGRDEPSVRDAEQRAMAIWYDTKEPIEEMRANSKGHVNYRKLVRHYPMRDGSRKRARVSIHPDARVQAIVEQTREAEMVQAIDRLRLIYTKKRKTVYILCSIPLDIPIDELVTWKQLTGDRRLSDVLAKCDAKGWDALPLPPRDLSRLFPDLWATPKAAERWIAKNPPAACSNIIRVWGVLADYRPKGQRSWSRGVVRHGADARSALAATLKVSPDDIVLKAADW
jgi:hypothetical protein